VKDEPAALVFPGVRGGPTREINNGSRGLREQAMKTGPDLGLSSLERVTGIEPALSAWEADVLPLNYTRVYEQSLVTLRAERACTISAQTWYRNR
jgi:hypothetical protein